MNDGLGGNIKIKALPCGWLCLFFSLEEDIQSTATFGF